MQAAKIKVGEGTGEIDAIWRDTRRKKDRLLKLMMVYHITDSLGQLMRVRCRIVAVET